MVNGMDWFFWSIGPKSISWISAFQPGNLFPWHIQLSCPRSREVLTCDTNLPGDQNLFTKARCQHNSNQGQRKQGRYEGTLEKPQFISNFWQPGHCLCPGNQALMKQACYSLGLRIHWTTFLCWIISPNSSARIHGWQSPELPLFHQSHYHHF